MDKRSNGVSALERLGTIADVQMGYPFRTRLKHDPGGAVAVIQMKDIDDTNLLRPENAIRTTLPAGNAHHLLREGDLLFRSRGRSNGAALVGAGTGPAVLAAPMLRIRPHGALPEYLSWFINAPATQAMLAATSEGTSVRMISAEALRNLPVPVPNVEIQRRIVEAAMLSQREQALMTEVAARRHFLVTTILMQSAQKGQ